MSGVVKDTPEWYGALRRADRPVKREPALRTVQGPPAALPAHSSRGLAGLAGCPHPPKAATGAFPTGWRSFLARPG